MHSETRALEGKKCVQKSYNSVEQNQNKLPKLNNLINKRTEDSSMHFPKEDIQV